MFCFSLFWLFRLRNERFWARYSSRYSWCVKSSRCKLDALVKLYLGLSKHTFQYVYLVTTCLLSCDWCVWIGLSALYLLEEGDGRCVCASWPGSTKHSILSLLLNPPLANNFIMAFVLNFLEVENVAHFFPFHRLHLDLMSLCAMIELTFVPF